MEERNTDVEILRELELEPEDGWIAPISWENSEKAMVPHSSTLAWKILWTEEPRRLQSMESLRVGYGWSDLAAAAWQNLNGVEVDSYEWAKKVVSWNGNDSWWRCSEDCWNNNKVFRVSHKLNWWQGLIALTSVWINLDYKCHQITLSAAENLFMKERISQSNRWIIALF